MVKIILSFGSFTSSLQCTRQRFRRGRVEDAVYDARNMLDLLLDDKENNLRIIGNNNTTQNESITTESNIDGVLSYVIYDQTGRLIKEESSVPNYLEFLPGVYVVKIYRGGELLKTFKKVISK